MHCKARCQVCFVHGANTVEAGLSLALQNRGNSGQSIIRLQTQQYGTTSQKRARSWPHIPRYLNPIFSPSRLQLPLLLRMPIKPINRQSVTSISTTPLVVIVSEFQTPRERAKKPTAMPKNRSLFAKPCSHTRRSIYLPLRRPILTVVPCPLHASLHKVTII